jgi:antitoxin (DNA-binding transcriptional repressor) of toxin-antitoxin stability system
VRRIALAKATASLAEHVNGLEREPLVVTVKGKPVAALVPLDGLDWEALSLGTNPDFLDLIEQSRRLRAKHAGVTTAELRQEFELAANLKRPKLKANGRRANGTKHGSKA